MEKTKPTNLLSKDLDQPGLKGSSAFAIFVRPWFVEGLFYITCIALLWTNEEPSKLNTLFAAWSAYALVVLALSCAVKSGTVLHPEKWIRVYFLQCLLLMLACDFAWLRGCIPRAEGFYTDQVRYDYWAAVLARSGMHRGVIAGQNYAGAIWYAGFIYWIFGVSKFYVVLFNGASSFISWVLFASVARHIEGHPARWQWLRFGCILPDCIVNFATVAKEPLSIFVVAVGVWMIAGAMVKKSNLYKLALPLIFVVLIGLSVRAITSAVVIVVASIWLWEYWGTKRRVAVIVLTCGILVVGYFATNYVMQLIGSAAKDWPKTASMLLNPATRIAIYADPSTRDSWNVILESLPVYFLPITSVIKGFFMMVAPMPIWKLPVMEIVSGRGTEEMYSYYEISSQQLTAWLFVFSIPCLFAAVFDVYGRHRKVWFVTSFTFIVLITLAGFLIGGRIEPRFRSVCLPFWLLTCGVGYYYGRPKRYVPLFVSILAIGFVIYMVPKLW